MRLLVSFALAAALVGAARAEDLPKPKGSIGVMISAETGSVVVVGTVPDSPAEKAGLKAGDVIVKVNDHKVKEKEATPEDVTAMAKEIFKHEPGTKIKITVKRDDKEKELEVTVGKPGEFTPKKDKE
jgi:S1-C subfamily serine protease